MNLIRKHGRMHSIVPRVLAATLALGFADVCQGTTAFSQQKINSTNGQLHQFAFDDMPPSDGMGGQVALTLSGDYSPRAFPPLSEGATVTLDAIAGSLLLHNEANGDGVASNTIAGLSFASSARTGGGNNVMLDYVFSLGGPLLDSLLQDQTITVNVQNTSDVSSTTYGGFVRVAFNYTPVPEGSTAALAGLAITGCLRKRRRHFVGGLRAPC